MASNFANKGAERQLAAVDLAEPSEDAGILRPTSFTIADFLLLPITVQGQPIVLAGAKYLSRSIRWIHVTELTDNEGLLQGGELILSTGMALPQLAAEASRYIAGLADQGAVGLVIELGHRFDALPDSLVQACRTHRLTLIALQREVPFVKITEAAHTLILNGQQDLLRLTAATHEKFTELSLTDAPVGDIVVAASALAGGQVVFANRMNQVIALCARGESTDELITRWRRHESSLNRLFSTTIDDGRGIVTVPIDVRGQQRGRLALFVSGTPNSSQVMVAERAAAALTIRLLMEGDEALISNATHTALSDIMGGRYDTPAGMHARTSALGHPTKQRHMLPVVLVTRGQPIAEIVEQALHDVRTDALAGGIGQNQWGVMLLLNSSRFEPSMDAFVTRVRELCMRDGLPRPTVAVGSVVVKLSDVRRSFAEAVEVVLAAAAAEAHLDAPKAYYRISDVRLRGLLFTLREDPHLQAFVERTLGPLLSHDAQHGGDYVLTVASFLKLRGNKSLTATAMGMSRQTLYERLNRIQHLLRVDLDDPETSTSVYAAIMMLSALQYSNEPTQKPRTGFTLDTLSAANRLA